MKWKRVAAWMIVAAAIAAGTWGWILYSHRLTPDRADVALAFEKICRAVRERDHIAFIHLVSYQADYIEPTFSQSDVIEPGIDPRWDISVNGTSALVRTMMKSNGTKEGITMQFVKKNGQWLFTGKCEIEAPMKIPAWKSIWRRITRWL